MDDVESQDVEHYRRREPETTRTGRGWFEAWVGDANPRAGDALIVDGPSNDEVVGRTLAREGASKIRAQIISTPDWLEPGLPIEVTDRAAHFPPPEDGRLDLRGASLLPKSDESSSLPFELPDIGLTDFDTERPAIQTGHTGVDLLSPVATGGCTLLLDNGPAAAGSLIVEALLAAMHDTLESKATLMPLELISPSTMRWWHLSADEPVDSWSSVHANADRHERWMGFRAAASWIAEQRADGQPSLFVADLPGLEDQRARPGSDNDEQPRVTVASVLNRLTDAMASTTRARVSCVLRLPLRDSARGADAIAETLPLGDVDTTIFVDDTGQFDPMRSQSDADLPDDPDWRAERERAYRALQTVRDLEQKRRIQGEDALTDREREAESLLEGLARPLSG